MKKICISKEYSETLGARYIEEGKFSGENFFAPPVSRSLK